MTGNQASDWKPRNLGGRFYDDPRLELLFWADRADNAGRCEPMVAVPVATLRAAAAVRECGARSMLHGDEDGPISPPVEIQCRLVTDHALRHFNGYVSWEL